MQKKCLLGEDAKKKLRELLTLDPETKLMKYEDILKDDKSFGYFKNENLSWTVFDNRNGYCWTEDCMSEILARFWLNLKDCYKCPFTLSKIKSYPDNGLMEGIENRGFDIINPSEFIFKRREQLFKAVSIGVSNVISDKYSVLLCPIVQYEHYNRLYECIQFNDVDEVNKFCELNKEYGVLATKYDYIFVAKNSDKGKPIKQK